MNQGFSYYFCLMIEGSLKDPDPDPHLQLMDLDMGCPKICGSGSVTLLKSVNYVK
jgi:hypothetical protein